MSWSPDVSTYLKNIGGLALSPLLLADAVKHGGVANYFGQRAGLADDPASRAMLQDSPFIAGMLGFTEHQVPQTGPQPPEGGPPEQTGTRLEPNLPPQSFGARAKESEAKLQASLFERAQAGDADAAVMVGIPLTPAQLAQRQQQAQDLAAATGAVVTVDQKGSFTAKFGQGAGKNYATFAEASNALGVAQSQRKDVKGYVIPAPGGRGYTLKTGFEPRPPQDPEAAAYGKTIGSLKAVARTLGYKSIDDPNFRRDIATGNIQVNPDTGEAAVTPGAQSHQAPPPSDQLPDDTVIRGAPMAEVSPAFSERGTAPPNAIARPEHAPVFGVDATKQPPLPAASPSGAFVDAPGSAPTPDNLAGTPPPTLANGPTVSKTGTAINPTTGRLIKVPSTTITLGPLHIGQHFVGPPKDVDMFQISQGKWKDNPWGIKEDDALDYVVYKKMPAKAIQDFQKAEEIKYHARAMREALNSSQVLRRTKDSWFGSLMSYADYRTGGHLHTDIHTQAYFQELKFFELQALGRFLYGFRNETAVSRILGHTPAIWDSLDLTYQKLNDIEVWADEGQKLARYSTALAAGIDRPEHFGVPPGGFPLATSDPRGPRIAVPGPVGKPLELTPIP